MLRNSVEFSQRWKSYLEEVGIQSKAVFIQIVTSGLLGQLISDIYVAKCIQYENVKFFLLELPTNNLLKTSI